jgi:hypothetical protein
MEQAELTSRDWYEGFEPEPLEFDVTPELNEQYLYSQQDYDPMYLDDGDGPALVHPSLLLNMSNTTRSPSHNLAPGVSSIHARDEVFFKAPAAVGQRFTVRWFVESTFEKRGRPYRITRATITDENDKTILVRKVHSTFAASS